ncbi:MFS transporter [Streptomyces telluris]|uniref:MFS transporter n=1 Tax=Streptomyces telluris TaxID=2720021 RepID=A0A9X2LQG8_9ACTN|nr:MFS transporter [Streptomyces telluris]MCQ8773750.1 MFS transporter [Streptomyces telluris]NJP77069.1 MFS transporter [Streptomyces telluris]
MSSGYAPAPGAVARTGRGFALLGAVQVVLILAITMLSPALPAIQHDLGLSGAQLTLVSAAYGLSFSGLLMLGGRLGDLMGRRRALVAGAAVFGLASAAAGLGPGFAFLLGGRFLQGVGAALAAPAAMSLVRSLYPDEGRHARALAVWGGLAGFGATAGMLLSGTVSTWVSWRWSFVVPVAVSLLAVVAARRVLPAGPDPVRVPLDVPGAVLVTAGLTVMSYGLVEAGERPWGAGVVWGPIAAGALLLAAFVAVELRVSHPLVPLGFLGRRHRATALWAVFIGSAGMSTIFFLLSLYFQEVRNASPLLTSAAFLPFSAAQVVTGMLAGRLIGRFGGRAVTVGGLLVAAAGLVLIGQLGADSAYAGTLLAGLIVFPVGIACVFSGSTVVALEDVEDERAGLAGGVVNTAMEVGPTVGLAVLVSLATAHASGLRDAGEGVGSATSSGYAFALLIAAAAFAASAVVSAVLLRSRRGARSGGGSASAGPETVRSAAAPEALVEAARSASGAAGVGGV